VTSPKTLIDRNVEVDPETLPIQRPRPYRQWLTSLVIIAVVGLAVFKVVTSDAISWQIVFDFLFQPAILVGVRNTAFITVVAGGIGVVLGLITAISATSKNPVLRNVARAYVWLFRGVPVLVQLIFWFNLGLLFDRVTIAVPFTDFVIYTESTNTLITPLVAVLLGFGINEGAYIGEIVRGGIISIPNGQHEAAISLGITPARTFRYVIMPQAIRVAIPAVANQLIILLKLSALASVITYGELLHAAQNIYSVNLRTIELLIVASFWYIILTTICTWIQGILEKRLNRPHATSPGNDK